MSYTVYQHYLPETEQSYIGITSQAPERRWGKDGAGYKGQKFYSAILKYGWSNFDHIIIDSGLTRKQAANMEKQLIKEFKTQNPRFGWNVDEGGFHWKGGRA